MSFEHIPIWEAIISFAFFTCLFLFMLVYSKINWIFKLLASVGSILIFILAFDTLNSSWGWPYVSTNLPQTFEVKWIDIQEPSLYDKGAIRLWVKAWQQNLAAGDPRVYEVPYTKAKHKESAENLRKLMQGQQVFGQNNNGAEAKGIIANMQRLVSKLLAKLGLMGNNDGTDGTNREYAKNTKDKDGWDFINPPAMTPPKDLQE